MIVEQSNNVEKGTEKMKHFNLTLSDDVYEQLREHAFKERISMTAIINRVVTQATELFNKQDSRTIKTDQSTKQVDEPIQIKRNSGRREQIKQDLEKANTEYDEDGDPVRRHTRYSDEED